MRRSCRKSFILVLTSCLSYAGATAHANGNEIEQPEIEIQRAITQLNNIQNQLAASALVNYKHALSPQKLTASEVYLSAVKNFKKANFRLTIKELNAYLNLEQSPDITKHLNAQFMLGFSYERLGKLDRAQRAYLRYIEGQSTASIDDIDRFIQVIQRSIALLTEFSASNEAETRRLFAAITGIKQTPAVSAEILFYAGAAAAELKRFDLAQEWLALSISKTNDDTLRLRAKYQLASTLMRVNELEKAESLLNEIRKADQSIHAEIIELASLSVARIAMKQANFAKAVLTYREVSTNGANARTALYETVFALAEAGSYDEATESATTFISKYPQDANIHRINALLGFLKLKSNQFDEAQAQFRESLSNLKVLEDTIRDRLSQASFIDPELLTLIDQATTTNVAPHATLKKLISNNKHLAEIHQQLQEVANEARVQIYTLGNLNTGDINPQWLRLTEQLERSLIDTLNVGHKIVATVQHLVQNNLTDIEKTQLAKSRKRRFDYMGKLASLRRRQESWAHWNNFMQLGKDAMTLFDHLNSLQAQNASAAALSDPQKVEDKLDYLITDEAVNERRKKLADVTRDLYILRTKGLAKLADHEHDAKLQAQYSDVLFEEFALLNEKLISDLRPSLRFFKEDLRHAWRMWEQTNNKLARQYANLNDEVDTELNALADQFITYVKKIDQLSKTYESLKSDLHQSFEQSKPQLTASLLRGVREQHSRYSKWLGDIDWLASEASAKEQSRISAKLELEKQISTSELMPW